MPQQTDDQRKVFDAVSEPDLVALARRLIRIPSFVFQEHDVADDLAGYLKESGFDVEMMEVRHPWEPEKVTRHRSPG